MASLKQLISKLHKLNELNLNDLTLERIEANSLMDQICKTLSSTLQKLSIENLTVNHCCLQQIAMLSNLEVCILHLRHILLSLFNPFFFKKKHSQTLKISPQNIDDSMIGLIADSKLKDLHIIQNEITPKTVLPCSAKVWCKFKRRANEMRVHLSARSNGEFECELLIQPEAPIYCVECENVFHFEMSMRIIFIISFIHSFIFQVSKGTFKRVIENYSNSLVIYCDDNQMICDNDVIEMVSKCPKLSILVSENTLFFNKSVRSRYAFQFTD